MRKADLIARIAEKHNDIAKVDVLVVVEAFFAEVKENLAQGENVYIRGFGSFIAKKRARKIGRNIKKNKAMEIPEHFIPAFKPAKIFVDQVRKSMDEKIAVAVVTEPKAAKTEPKATKAKTTKTTVKK